MLKFQIVNQRFYEHSQLRKNQKSIKNGNIMNHPSHGTFISGVSQSKARTTAISASSRDKVVNHAHDFPSRKGRTSPPQMVRVQIPSATSTNRL